MVLWMVEMEVADPERPERSGRIAHGLPTPPSGPCPDPYARRTSPACRPNRPPVERSSLAGQSSTSCVPRRWGRTESPASPREPLDRLLGWLGLSYPGIGVHLGEGLDIELDLTVAYGVPVAEVARQVDSAIRYALHTAIDRDVRRLTIHIDGLRFGPGGGPPSVVHVDPGAVGPRDLADSGTDVA